MSTGKPAEPAREVEREGRDGRVARCRHGESREPRQDPRCPSASMHGLSAEIAEPVPVGAVPARVPRARGVPAVRGSRRRADPALAGRGCERLRAARPHPRAQRLPPALPDARQPRRGRGRGSGGLPEPPPPWPPLPARVALLDLPLPRRRERRAEPAPQPRPRPRARARARPAPRFGRADPRARRGIPRTRRTGSRSSSASRTRSNSCPTSSAVAVVLYDIEGLSYKDIAESLGIPEGTVKSRIHRARLGLRERLRELVQSPPTGEKP